MILSGRVAAATLVAILATGTLAGCAAPSPQTPQLDDAAQGAATASPNVEPCTYLAGGAFDDAVDFFGTYAADREAADPAVLTDVIERFETAQQSSTGSLSLSLGRALEQLHAIDQRYTAGTPADPDVDYETLRDALDTSLAACATALE
jgi:hypothetical protein